MKTSSVSATTRLPDADTHKIFRHDIVPLQLRNPHDPVWEKVLRPAPLPRPFRLEKGV